MYLAFFMFASISGGGCFETEIAWLVIHRMCFGFAIMETFIHNILSYSHNLNSKSILTIAPITIQCIGENSMALRVRAWEEVVTRVAKVKKIYCGYHHHNICSTWQAVHQSRRLH